MASRLLRALAAAIIVQHSHARSHEKRATSDDQYATWRSTIRLSPDAIVPVRIGLKQNNLDAGAERLMSISHPQSPDYGKTLTEEQVSALFSPAEESVDAVRDWLVSSGVPLQSIAHSDSKGWLAVDLTAEHAERLFSSELYEFEHVKTGRSAVPEN
jgi:tripeptidyl-peptidase-1